MKKLITNYTFNAAAKTITFTDYGSITLEAVLLITNVTDNIIIYNFAAVGKGGTVATNVLTLDYDTTSMDNADDLQIFYDDTAVNFATSEKQDTIIGHVDGIETKLDTVITNTTGLALESGGNLDYLQGIETYTQVVSQAVSGTEMQVDVLTMPTVTVTATNLDIRDLTSVSDSISAVQSGSWTVTANIGTTGNLALESGGNLDYLLGIDTTLQAINGKLVSGTDIGDVTINNAAGASAVNIQDGGNSITVDGSVSATQSGTWNITNISGTISLPTGAATETTLSSLNGKVTACNTGAVVIGSALPAGTNNIGDVDILSIAAGTNYIGKVRLTDGTTDAEIVPLTGYNAAAVAIVDGSGNQITSFGGGTQYTEGDIDASITGTAIMWEDTSDTLRPVSAAKPLPVDIKNTSVAVTQATASSLNAQAVGNVAHDSADSGNPVKIGGIAKNYGSLPTAVTDADRVNANFDRYGSLFVQVGGSNVGVETVEYSAAQTNTAMITVATNSAIRVYGFVINISYAVYNAVTLTIGFGTSTTPTTTKCLFRSNGMAPGTYIVQLPAPIVGASDEDLRVTLTDPGASFVNITIYRDTVSI